MPKSPKCPKCGHPEFDWTIKAFHGMRHIMVFCANPSCNAVVGVTPASDVFDDLKKEIKR